MEKVSTPLSLGLSLLRLTLGFGLLNGTEGPTVGVGRVSPVEGTRWEGDVRDFEGVGADDWTVGSRPV